MKHIVRQYVITVAVETAALQGLDRELEPAVKAVDTALDELAVTHAAPSDVIRRAFAGALSLKIAPHADWVHEALEVTAQGLKP